MSLARIKPRGLKALARNLGDSMTFTVPGSAQDVSITLTTGAGAAQRYCLRFPPASAVRADGTTYYAKNPAAAGTCGGSATTTTTTTSTSSTTTTLSAAECAQRPWSDVSLSPDQRTVLLMACMTLDQKIAVVSNEAVAALGIPAAVGNFVDGAEGAPAGVGSSESGTGLPSPSALAAAFDESLAHDYGGVVGDEVKNRGRDGVWGPTVNILRTELAGRGNEYYGEDPFLSSRMAVNWIQGFQAQGVIVQLKHFVANDQEGYGGVQPIGGSLGGRQEVNVIADDRTLHEIYLAPFEAAIREAHNGSVMCSYNKLNGPYACEDTWLLVHVLRELWQWPGFVAPDFGANKNPVNNFNDGQDTGHNHQEVQAMLASGVATETTLDVHARHILRTFFAFGVMDRPAYVDDESKIDKAGHAAVAERVEEQAITLLENRDGILPLDASTLASIAVIGPAADSYVRGSGSMEVAPFRDFLVTGLQGIRNRVVGSSVQVSYDDGTNLATAVTVAQAADVAVVFVNDSEAEGTDKTGMALGSPGNYGLRDLQGNDQQTQNPLQDELIQQVAAANPNTIVVLETGEPVLTPWRDQVKGLLEAWYPGETGGTAIARVLFGDVDPGGRLSATFPLSDGDGPANNLTNDPEAYPGVDNNETYKEGVLVGYRWFDAHDVQPVFPFGFGLSYTTFGYSALQVQPRVDGTPGATVSIVVTNSGPRGGSDVAQLYLGLPPPDAATTQPPRQLKGFRKVELPPGDSQQVTFDVDARALSYWRTSDESWQVAPGCYTVMVGRSSRDIVAQDTLAIGGAQCP